MHSGVVDLEGRLASREEAGGEQDDVVIRLNDLTAQVARRLAAAPSAEAIAGYCPPTPATLRLGSAREGHLAACLCVPPSVEQGHLTDNGAQ